MRRHGSRPRSPSGAVAPRAGQGRALPARSSGSSRSSRASPRPTSSDGRGPGGHRARRPTVDRDRPDPGRRRLRLVALRRDRRRRGAIRDRGPADGLHVPTGSRRSSAATARPAAPARSPLRTPSWALGLAHVPRLGGPPLRAERRFWAVHPDLPDKPITAWQIWNEGELGRVLRAAADVGRYAQLVQAASRRSTARTRTRPSSSAACSATRSAGVGAGIRATDFLRELHATRDRAGLRGRRRPPLRRQGALGGQAGQAGRARRARGGRPGRGHLDHGGRLGLGRQAQPAQPRAARRSAPPAPRVPIRSSPPREPAAQDRALVRLARRSRWTRAAANGARVRPLPRRLAGPKARLRRVHRFTGGS